MGSHGLSHRWYAYAHPSQDSSAAPEGKRVTVSFSCLWSLGEGEPKELITQCKPFEGRELSAEQLTLQPVHLVHPGTREELF